MLPKPAWAALDALKTMSQDFVYEFGGRVLDSKLKLDGLPLWEGPLSIKATQPPISVGMAQASTPPAALTSKDSFIWTDPNATLSVHKSGELHALVFPDLAVFTIQPTTAQVRVYSSTDAATLTHLLLDQVLPRLLAWSGEIVIHAGAIATKDFAIAFLGESGHGKSSMTAGFIQSSAQLLSDDAVTLRQAPDGIYAAGLYPSLRLWPRALDGLTVTALKTSDMAHYSTKRRVRIDEAAAIDPPKLDAIFQLKMGEADSKISITRLSERDVMMALIEGSFRLDPTAQPQGQTFFTQMDAIKSRIKGYRLCYPRGYEHLPAVRAAIAAHMKEIT